jgi:hypothetical protein
MAGPGKPGPPLKCADTALVEGICKAIENGLPLSHACGLMRVSYTSMCKWLARAAEDEASGIESDFTRLSVAIAAARAAKTERLVSMIQRIGASKEDAKPLQFMLERTEPHEFRQRNHVETEARITVSAESLADELSKLSEKLSQAENGE